MSLNDEATNQKHDNQRSFLKKGGPMGSMPVPPKMNEAFHKRYPKLSQAYTLIAEAGKEGPLDERTARLIKLGIVFGAMREGAVHANVRKALAMGISNEEIEQIICLASRTLGLPAVVAVYSWVQDILRKEPE
jgi:4-carboxymuconolactone decarboxylase